MASIPTRAVNLAAQLVAITAVLPDSRGAVRGGELTCDFRLRPSPVSRTYTVHLIYRHGQRPRVTITDPELALHPGATTVPHVYPGNELCLYYPGQWNGSMLLANTILPWTAEWLLHYEVWLVIGRWTGGGTSHPAGAAGY